jgi:hypothetical protein
MGSQFYPKVWHLNIWEDGRSSRVTSDGLEIRVLRAWSPADGAVEKWLGHEGGNFTSGWIHSWVSSQLDRLLGSVTYLQEISHFGLAFGEPILSPDLSSCSLLSSHDKVRAVIYHILPLCWFSLTPGPWQSNQATMAWNPWKWSKIHLPPFQLFLSGILSQQRKSNTPSPHLFFFFFPGIRTSTKIMYFRNHLFFYSKSKSIEDFSDLLWRRS